MNPIEEALRNRYFRRVISTEPGRQIVVMSLPPGEEIGAETHPHTQQTFVFVSGHGIATWSHQRFAALDGLVLVVPPGTRHNVVNTGRRPLKFYTIYEPPAHIDGRIHRTRAEAEADLEDAAYGHDQ